MSIKSRTLIYEITKYVQGNASTKLNLWCHTRRANRKLASHFLFIPNEPIAFL